MREQGQYERNGPEFRTSPNARTGTARTSLTPVAGLASKVDNVTNDVSEVKNSLSDLNTQLNKLRAQLTDINNAIKVLQAPAPAPPAPEQVKPRRPLPLQPFSQMR